MNKGRKKLFPAVLVVLAVLLNLAARCSTKFSDYYVNHIFPLWVETYGRLTGLFPFSVGEWLLYLAVLLTVFFILGGICRLAFGWRRRKREKDRAHMKEQKKGWRSRAAGLYQHFAWLYCWLFGIVCMIMTLNCFLLYQTSLLPERFFTAQTEEKSYGAKELGILRDYVVQRANELAEGFDRDEQGYIIYEEDIREEAVREMKRLGERYEQLSGYYPEPKPLFLSGFYSQQYIMGYYFPFSMEANYNTRMYVANMPVTMCHELSHLKGFIREDEANFIGYLACVGSEDDFFRYSAYLSVLGYLDRDFRKAVEEQEYEEHPAVSKRVSEDKRFLTEEAWQQVEENAIISTKTVKKGADAFLNTTLTVNGVSDGTASYGRVVKLLLQYYDGILY